MSDRDEYERDLQEMRRAATEALVASIKRPLTEDEAMAAAYMAGIPNDVYQELHPTLKTPERF